jgi:phosphoenolpyruvate synthase/pyruvate phosphate dikinase
MTDNGFFGRLDALLADPEFVADPDVRDVRLLEFRADMLKAPLDEGLQETLKAKLEADYPGQVMRFRTSTNSEDLEGFPCAGCYESQTGDPADWEDVLYAIRKTYASAWLFRTFEERSYYGVDHKSVGMALLVHEYFPSEEANGVAVTANPFDALGVDPAFYVNVQYGGQVEVVHPISGVSSDSFLYYYSEPNQPITYISHSSLVPDGTNVLTTKEVRLLGKALAAIHDRLSAAYGPAAGITTWYAMDVEFKFDGGLWIKQARPYPGRGQ